MLTFLIGIKCTHLHFNWQYAQTISAKSICYFRMCWRFAYILVFPNIPKTRPWALKFTIIIISGYKIFEKLKRPKLSKKTIIVLLLTGVGLDMMRPLEFRSSTTIRNSPTAEMRRSSRTGFVLRESQTDSNENYSVGYTVKTLPLVKIYDYLPYKETDAAKARRFNTNKSLA